MGDGEIEETGGGEGSRNNEDYGERVKAQGDITRGELAGMAEAKEEKVCVGSSVILLMRYSCGVLAFLSPRRGHLPVHFR